MVEPQSEPVSWLDILENLQQLVPINWLWIILTLGIAACLQVIDIGDKLAGIFGWLGIESPFLRPKASERQSENSRSKLLRVVERDVAARLAGSLHEMVKLDLYIEEQPEKVGKTRLELIPKDSVSRRASRFEVRPGRVLYDRRRKNSALALKFTQKTIDIFERPATKRKLLILGEAGSGKTTELLKLAQALLNRASKDSEHPIPILLDLATWQQEPLEKWIIEQLSKLYRVPDIVSQGWLDNHELLLLLDGLDELGLRQQKKCIRSINKFLKSSQPLGVVVCSRSEEYDAGRVKLKGLNTAIYLEPLREEQIYEYFDKLERLSVWENIRNSRSLLKLAKKPLFLSMLLVTYQGIPIDSESELFDAYIDKQIHNPENKTTYKENNSPSEKQILIRLSWLAKQLDRFQESDFLIERLQPNWLPSERQVFLYETLLKVISGIAGGLIVGIRYDIETKIAIGLVIAIVAGVNAKTIEPKDKLRWSLKKGLEVALPTCQIVSILATLSYGVLLGPRAGFLFGPMTGVITSLLCGFVTGFIPVSIEEKEIPNQGIRREVKNALIIGVSSGLFFGIAMIGGMRMMFHYAEFPLRNGLISGSIVGLSIGLSFGLEAALKHFLLRVILTSSGYTPWNYALFLEHAAKHRFIQRVGGRYRFTHGLLRKHFANINIE